MVEIKNIEDPRIELYRSLRKTPASHSGNKLFIAESRIIVDKLLESNLELVSIFATPDYFNEKIDILNNRGDSIQCYYASKDIMSEITGYKHHSGIMAMAKQPEDTPISDMADRIVLLSGLINAENVGAIIRNCTAFGFNSIICDETSASPYLRRSVRVSMGEVFSMKINHSHSVVYDIELLKDSGYAVYSIENIDDADEITSFTPENKHIVIFGSESNGINEKILELSDKTIKIKYLDRAPSLNVAVTSGIVLHRFSSSLI